jgi:hypothetical protein
MINTLPVLVITNQVIGDNFGFVMLFPYNVNNWEITLTVKKALTQTDALADAKAVANPTGVSPDSLGNYSVPLALTVAQTLALVQGTYYFDIVTKDDSAPANVAHVISPQSTVSFIGSVTLTP